MTNLIGISARSGGGKDTVGQIIQYLTDMDRVGYTHSPSEKDLQHYLNNRHDLTASWRIRKFADRLKECAGIIIQIPRATFEDHDVKNGLISEDWGDLTVRKFLQLFGTEVGRSIHPNFWINALFADYKKTALKWDVDGNSTVDNYPNWIITDCRFHNEAEAIRSRGGILIRLRRNYDVPSEHSSETDLDDYPHFNHYIDNTNTSIDELIAMVRNILIMEKIIKG